jgi:hypothetical protein
MTLEIDGFAVFRVVGGHPEAFAAIADELAKVGRTLVVKQIRHKATGLKAMRDIRGALGAEAFGLITDGMADAQIKSLAVKLDKHNPELKTAGAAAQRLHILKLADGSAEPLDKQKAAGKPAKAKKTPEAKTPAPLGQTDRIHFSSAGAMRKR